MYNGDNNLRRFGNFRLDTEKKVLWFEETICDVPVKAVELLCALVESKGELVTKDALLEKIWQDSFVEESVLPQNVYFLRKLFKKYGIEENLIQTIPRRGYRFAGELVEIEEEEIVIERETFERKFITESDISEDDLNEAIKTLNDAQTAQIIQSHKKEHTERRTRLFSNPKVSAFYFVVLLLLFGLTSTAFWIFSNQTNKNSAKALPFENRNLTYEPVTESGRVVAVGLSPDNQNAVYVVNTPENKYEMILHHLPTGSETVIVKAQDAHLANINFSPDGNYIYYIGNDANEKLTVYKMPLYGGVSQPVLQNLVHYFTVSPDGEWLAFLRRVPEEMAHYLEIARSRDGSERRTVAIRKDKKFFGIWGTAPAWSPDGKKLIAAAFTKNDDETKPAKNHLVEIDVINGKQTPVKTPEHWRGVHEPYYAPDGKNIYLKVRENTGEPMQIWKLQIESGEARNLTNDMNDYREFRAASDESFLMTAVWSKSENLFLVPVESPDNFRQMTFDTQGQNGAEGLNWTIDGKNLIYTKTKGFGTGNIWTMNVETGETRQLTKEENSSQGRIDVTPDGKSMVYASSRSGTFQIWRMDLDGTNQQQLTDGKNVDFSEISSDGRWIYFADNGLWKMPVEGGEAVKIMKKNPGRIGFSPADPRVFCAYLHDDNEKTKTPWRFVIFNTDDLSTYKDLQLSKIGGLRDWSPDGQKIYYIGRGESFNNVWMISPETLETEQITNFQDQRISNMSLSPDGKTLAVSRGASIGKIIKISGF